MPENVVQNARSRAKEGMGMRDETRSRTPHAAGSMWWNEKPAGIEMYDGKGKACVIRWSALEHALKRWRPGKRPATPHNSAMDAIALVRQLHKQYGEPWVGMSFEQCLDYIGQQHQ